MSRVQQLKQMWEKKAKNQASTVPPVKPLPNKMTVTAPPPAIKSTTPTTTITQPVVEKKEVVIEPVQKKQEQIEKQHEQDQPKMSISDLRNKMENTIIKGLTKPPAEKNLSQSYKNVPSEHPEQVVEPKKDPRDIKPLIGREKMPTFQERRKMVEKCLENKKNESTGYQTGPPPESENILYLKQQETSHQSLTPEERTDLVIKKVFSTQGECPTNFVLSETPSESSSGIKNQTKETSSNQTFLSSQETVKNLNLRGAQKKEKRDMGDFDDA